jgi:alcohol dehydrogenase (cytochrome c)
MQHWKIILSLLTIPAFAQFTPVTDRMLENPDPGDWLMWRRTLNSWG